MNAFAPVSGIAVRPARPADRARIGGFVARHPDAQLFHRPQWSEAVEQGCGQRGHYLVAEDEGGGIAGVLPLTAVRSRLFGSALVSTGFGVGGGILADTSAAAARLAEAAWDLARQLDCPTLELRGGPVPDGFHAKTGVYADFARDIPQGDDAILKAIPRKQRAEVRRAQGFGLTVSVGRSSGDLDAHYRIYAESVRNLGTPVFPRALFRAMLDVFGDDADILTVSDDGVPISSVFSFYDKGVVLPYWGGGTGAARHRRGNELAYYALMCHAARRGCTRFDFGRSKLGTGPYAFKKNWGFEPEPLTYAVRTADGVPPREINPLDPKYRLKIQLWQKLPLWLANRLGPAIARGLG
ncbi:MAG TPA: FemAB family XrtA/PEP-CTERM system-associated protein [Allosphingosinicella sp.]